MNNFFYDKFEIYFIFFAFTDLQLHAATHENTVWSKSVATVPGFFIYLFFNIFTLEETEHEGDKHAHTQTQLKKTHQMDHFHIHLTIFSAMT